MLSRVRFAVGLINRELSGAAIAGLPGEAETDPGEPPVPTCLRSEYSALFARELAEADLEVRHTVNRGPTPLHAAALRRPVLRLAERWSAAA